LPLNINYYHYYYFGFSVSDKQKLKKLDWIVKINFTIFAHLNNENLNDHEMKKPHLHSSASSDFSVETEWSPL